MKPWEGKSLFFEVLIVKKFKHRVVDSHFFPQNEAKFGKVEPRDWREREKETDLLLIASSEYLIQTGLMWSLL